MLIFTISLSQIAAESPQPRSDYLNEDEESHISQSSTIKEVKRLILINKQFANYLLVCNNKQEH